MAGQADMEVHPKKWCGSSPTPAPGRWRSKGRDLWHRPGRHRHLAQGRLRSDPSYCKTASSATRSPGFTSALRLWGRTACTVGWTPIDEPPACHGVPGLARGSPQRGHFSGGSAPTNAPQTWQVQASQHTGSPPSSRTVRPDRCWAAGGSARPGGSDSTFIFSLSFVGYELSTRFFCGEAMFLADAQSG